MCINKQKSILVIKNNSIPLCEALKSLGHKVLYFPTLQFLSMITEEVVNEFQQKQASYDRLIFVSPQAVHYGHKLLKNQHRLKLAAIGESTASALRNHGFEVDCVPEKNWTSEGLLALQPLQQVRGQRIGIVRGDSGRELIYNILENRGAAVDYIEVYKRTRADINEKPLITVLSANQLKLTVATSCAAILQLMDIVGQFRNVMIQQPIMVSSERLKKLAHELHFQTILLAENASNQALLEAVKNSV